MGDIDYLMVFLLGHFVVLNADSRNSSVTGFLTTNISSQHRIMGKTRKHRANGGGSDSCYFVCGKPDCACFKLTYQKGEKSPGDKILILVKTKKSFFTAY